MTILLELHTRSNIYIIIKIQIIGLHSMMLILTYLMNLINLMNNSNIESKIKNHGLKKLK